MAMIKCDECGKDISDKAAACVACGAPIRSAPSDSGAIRGSAAKTAYIETIDHKTGKTMRLEISEKDLEQLQRATSECKPIMSRDALHKFVDELNVSVEVKALLIKLLDHAMSIAGTFIAIGRKIIELLVYFSRKFPNMAMGMIVGAVLGAIFSSIPLLGWALGSLVTPILILLGAGLGFWQDMKDISLKESIRAATEETFGGFKKYSASAKL